MQRRLHDVRGVVAPSGLEFERHLSGGAQLHPFVGLCGSGDGAAKLLQPLELIGIAAYRRK